MSRRNVPCLVCGSKKHTSSSCTSPQAAHYAALCDEAVKAFGSQRAAERMLGFSGHGTLKYRLTHPRTIRRENELALEALMERVNRGRDADTTNCS